MEQKKINPLPFVVAIISILVIALYPIIFWDALGNGAQHFMQYGNPGVSGDSSGNSSVQFFFGTFWTRDFNVLKLFSGQWRVVMGVDSNAGTPASDALGTITLISVIGLLIASAYEVAIFVLEKVLKTNPIVEVAKKYGSIAAAVLALLAVIFVGVPTLIMATKIKKFGFRSQDFNAYGGIKGIVESILAIFFVVINALRVVKIFKAPKNA